MSRRRQYDSQFKAQVAIEAIKNQQTLAQIASEYGVHPNQVSQWKKHPDSSGNSLNSLPKVGQKLHQTPMRSSMRFIPKSAG